MTQVPTGWVRLIIRANAGGRTLILEIRCDDWYEADDGSLVLCANGESVMHAPKGWREAGLVPGVF
mgnify:CR=1 FL=1